MNRKKTAIATTTASSELESVYSTQDEAIAALLGLKDDIPVVVHEPGCAVRDPQAECSCIPMTIYHGAVA